MKNNITKLSPPLFFCFPSHFSRRSTHAENKLFRCPLQAVFISANECNRFLDVFLRDGWGRGMVCGTQRKSRPPVVSRSQMEQWERGIKHRASLLAALYRGEQVQWYSTEFPSLWLWISSTIYFADINKDTQRLWFTCLFAFGPTLLFKRDSLLVSISFQVIQCNKQFLTTATN